MYNWLSINVKWATSWTIFFASLSSFGNELSLSYSTIQVAQLGYVSMSEIRRFYSMDGYFNVSWMGLLLFVLDFVLASFERMSALMFALEVHVLLQIARNPWLVL